jgi:hypothetical protein
MGMRRLQVKNSTVNAQNMNPAFLRRRVRHRSQPTRNRCRRQVLESLPLTLFNIFLAAAVGNHERLTARASNFLIALTANLGCLQDLGVSKTVTTKDHAKSLQVRGESRTRPPLVLRFLLPGLPRRLHAGCHHVCGRMPTAEGCG